jgi:hypothetical protein
MGKIENIIHALSPADNLFENDYVTYHVIEDTVDVVRHPRAQGSWRLVIHSQTDKSLGVFFTLRPIFSFIQNREELQNKHEEIVFPGQSVFGLLEIKVPSLRKGTLENLHDLSIVMQENSSTILNAFSDKIIRKTYQALINNEGNNTEAMRKNVKRILGFHD